MQAIAYYFYPGIGKVPETSMVLSEKSLQLLHCVGLGLLYYLLWDSSLRLEW